MTATLEKIDWALLDGWQRNFPLVPDPFAEIGNETGIPESEVIARLNRLSRAGIVSRIGATCRPNTIGASTLAAIAAPDWRIDEVAGIIGAETGVNHSYLREDAWNIWFVATGPDREYVDGMLGRIRTATGLEVLDLPLVRPFNIDLGFSLEGMASSTGTQRRTDVAALKAGDRQIIQGLCSGLAFVPRPFAGLGDAFGITEGALLERIRVLLAAGILSRFGVIVRHRALGWRANAMVVWQVPETEVESAGLRLIKVPGVTLCYQRRSIAGTWPYNLYCMIHARSRTDAMSVLDRACDVVGLCDIPHRVLFSVRCFKQIGAMVAVQEGAAA